MRNGESNDTTDNVPGPLIIQNDGNVIANITWISANNSLWTSSGAGLETSYFQFKVDNGTTEAGSFNWTNSTTTWSNITSVGVVNRTAVAYLLYNDSSDTAEIELKVVAPTNETAGMKSVTIFVIGQDTT